MGTAHSRRAKPTYFFTMSRYVAADVASTYLAANYANAELLYSACVYLGPIDVHQHKR